MQIILMDKVVNLGNLGDVVKVKEGYARNYLIPKGFAKRATAENRKVFEEKRAELEKVQAEKLAAAQEIAGKLNGFKLQLARKAGVDGKLFGSVGTADIAEALLGHDFKVDRSSIRMATGHLKHIGETEISVALHPDVVAMITVTIAAEQ